MKIAIEGFAHLGLVFLLFLVLTWLAGCSTTNDVNRSLDLSVSGLYNRGQAARTRNQTPQGGTDEKSDIAPVEPAK
jgi:outer membrane protein assembly factor BamD (BamD/ComL family)